MHRWVVGSTEEVGIDTEETEEESGVKKKKKDDVCLDVRSVGNHGPESRSQVLSDRKKKLF